MVFGRCALDFMTASDIASNLCWVNALKFLDGLKK